MSSPNVLVLPFPAQGHVNPFVSLAQKLMERGLKITFVNTDFNHERVVSSMVEQDNPEGSSIRLVSIPDGLGPADARNDLGKLVRAILSTMPAMLEKLIQGMSSCDDDNNRISCIVADVSMGWALEVGRKLGIKGAVFSPASAAMFAMQYKIPMLIEDGVIDSDGFPITEKTFQLSPSMRAMDIAMIPWFNISSDSTTQKITFDYIRQAIKGVSLTEWWLCNTAYEIEPAVFSFIPKLLPIGPLLRSNETKRSLGQFWEEDLSCLHWLDQQPRCSVLYVAFGSFTLFDKNQFKELALALDLTNRPFLWVVRQDPNGSTQIAYPDEFKGSRGKIVGWAPQQKVLSHPAIACFISHCGWNSTMEGLSSGVPFLCWPYFADQHHNKYYICDELKVGLGFDSNESGIVSSEEIKKKVDQLLSNVSMRERSVKVKEMVTSNIAEGGRSSENFNRFVKWLKL